MDPIAFEIGPLAIRWYGLLICISITLGIVLAYVECIRHRIDPDHILTIAIFAIPAALIGSRLYYVIFNWDYFSVNLGDIAAIWQGGLAIHGGVIGGIFAGYFVVRKYNLDFWKMADICIPGVALGQAIGRWGNYFNQEAYGYVTDLPWAMYIAGAYRHPTFLYESLWCVLIFAYLMYRRYQPKIRQGELFASYIILYSIGRIVIESFRTDSLMIGSMMTAQVISGILIVLGVLIYLFYVRNAPRYNKLY